VPVNVTSPTSAVSDRFLAVPVVASGPSMITLSAVIEMLPLVTKFPKVNVSPGLTTVRLPLAAMIPGTAAGSNDGGTAVL